METHGALLSSLCSFTSDYKLLEDIDCLLVFLFLILQIPQQLFGDFKAKRESGGYESFESQTKGASAFGPLHELFPAELRDSLIQGIHDFSRQIPGFDRRDAILSGVESRTSSPVRIHRDENFESQIKGLFPCGEGAGYAGGITSAAMDGIKVAEELGRRYCV